MSDVLTSTATAIIRDAALLLEVTNIKAPETTDALRILNLMIKGWQSREYLWKLSDVTVTLTPGTQSYLVGPGGAGTLLRARPLRLKYAVRRNGGIDIPLELVSRQEYQELPQKTQQGPPVVAYYDPKTTNGSLSIWYTGDTSNTTLICTFADPVDLFDDSSDSPDFPDEWIEAITYNLSVRMAPMFGRSAPQEVIDVASESLSTMIAFDAEPASINFMPERQ